MLRLIYFLLEVVAHLWDFVNNRTAAFLKKKGRKNAKRALRKRAALKRKRKVILLLFNVLLIVYVIAAVAFAIFAFYSEHLGWWWKIIIGISSLSTTIKALSSISFETGGNITTWTAEDVINSGISYALYLRAFEADNRRISFKEEELVVELSKQNIATVAVGLPEEVDAPPGAVRVYVDNDTWQEKVKALMERALSIFVRIGDTEPCLWELNQVLSLPNKLYLIIEGADDYSAVYSKCPNIPEIVTFSEGQFYIFERMDDGKWKESFFMAKKKVKDVENDGSVKQFGPSIWNKSFSNAYVKSLLDFYPVPNKDSLREYERTITNLDKNTIQGLGYDNNNIIAYRLMDLIEAYYSVGGVAVVTNIKEYLQLLEKYKPLTDELQLRKEKMAKEVEQVIRSFMVTQDSPQD